MTKSPLQPRLHVLITCHNRREHTLRILRELEKQETAEFSLRVIIFDDGSSDGTAQDIYVRYPRVEVLHGDGSSFWAQSMALAEQHLFRSSPEEHDYLLWLNDDVSLKRNALSAALMLAAREPDTILIGAMRDPETGKTTYSGFTRDGRHPLHYTKVDPANECIPVETFNGNFVLIPFNVAQQLGGIDGRFSHSWADIDYGLRATQSGVPVLLMPGYSGECAENLKIPEESVQRVWTRFIGPKGSGNPKSLKRILRRHSRQTWLLYFCATYILWAARQTRSTLKGLGLKHRSRPTNSRPSMTPKPKDSE